MKRTLVVLITAAFECSLGGVAVGNPLAAHWSFNDPAEPGFDDSLYGHAAAATGGIWSDEALSFGAGDYAVAYDGPGEQSQPFDTYAVSIRFKYTESIGEQLLNRGGAPGTFKNFFVDISPTGRATAGHTTSAGDTVLETDPAFPLNDGQWHQLTLSYDGMKLRLYRDGQLDGMRTASPPIYGLGDPAPVVIAANSARDLSFTATVDDVLIMDRDPHGLGREYLAGGTSWDPLDRLAKWDPDTESWEPVAEDSITGGMVHVLSHGWGKGERDWVDEQLDDDPNTLPVAWNNPDSESFPTLGELAKSMTENLPDHTVLAYSWLDMSATPERAAWALELADAQQSAARTDSGAAQLKRALEKVIDTDEFDGKLNLIGHSHGAAVVTKATDLLEEAGTLHVDHLMLLDSPENIAPRVAHAANNLGPILKDFDIGTDDGQIYVDNYPSEVGRLYYAAAGALNEIVNVKLRPMQHGVPAEDVAQQHTYPNTWLKDALEAGEDVGLDWSPLLNGPPDDPASYYLQDADDEFEVNESAILLYPLDRIIPTVTYTGDTEGSVEFEPTGAVLSESSDAFWDLTFAMGRDDVALVFDYSFLDAGDGDELGLWVDGVLRYLVAGSEAGAGPRTTWLDIGDLEAGYHFLTVGLHSFGDPNAEVSVGDFRVATMEITAIPEPTTAILALMAALILGSARHKA